MLIVPEFSKELMCHQSANRDAKPFGCRGENCSAWRWLGSSKVPTRSGDYLFNRPVGYCALLPEPSIQHLEICAELGAAPTPPATPTDDDDSL